MALVSSKRTRESSGRLWSAVEEWRFGRSHLFFVRLAARSRPMQEAEEGLGRSNRAQEGSSSLGRPQDIRAVPALRATKRYRKRTGPGASSRAPDRLLIALNYRPFSQIVLFWEGATTPAGIFGYTSGKPCFHNGQTLASKESWTSGESGTNYARSINWHRRKCRPDE